MLTVNILYGTLTVLVHSAICMENKLIFRIKNTQEHFI